MPIVQINLLKGRTEDQKRAMVREVTDAIVKTTNSRIEAVKIIINEIEQNHFADAGILRSDKK